MTTTRSPICMFCARYTRDEDLGFRCDAFPEGIPDAIIENERDHRRPVAGDHGLQFAPKDADAIAYADGIFGKEVPA